MPIDAAALAFAVAIDAAFGDPPTPLHPVAWFGRAAASAIARLPTAPRARAFVSGLGLVLVSVVLAVALGVGVERLLARAPVALGVVLRGAALSFAMAFRGLLDAGRALVAAHEREGLDAARARLSWLCSRDPKGLDESGLANGTIESLAENLSDSVVGPLFYFALFGLPGAFAYRVVNTLDAMVGYRGRYEWLGKPSARLDDLLNLVPARLTAFALASAGVLLGLDARRGFAVYAADRGLTESPNAGHPMAITSGLLGLRLDKPGHYVLGASLRAPVLGDVERAVALVRMAGGVAVLALVAGTVFHG